MRLTYARNSVFCLPLSSLRSPASASFLYIQQGAESSDTEQG